MVVQAGAAEDLLDRDPGKARAPLALVQETGRQAVAELSRMLGLLRLRGARVPTGGCTVIRVLLVDDQALVRGGFRSILNGQQDIEVVGEAADGVEGIDLALTTSPDVILMDASDASDATG